ncbi:protein translocase subunit SecF, partial [Patescibacteria group bacterium]
MFVVKYRKIFFGISGVLVGLSLFSVLFFGLNFGIDFKGGAITEVAYISEMPNIEELRVEVEKLELGGFTIQQTDENGVLLRTRDLTEDERVFVMNTLSFGGTVNLEEKRYNSIGPIVGEELKKKAW